MLGVSLREGWRLVVRTFDDSVSKKEAVVTSCARIRCLGSVCLIGVTCMSVSLWCLLDRITPRYSVNIA